MKTEHAVEELCDIFKVSRSGYYDWCSRKDNPGPRTREDELLRGRIQVFHAQSHETYGSPRIQKDLRDEGAHHGRNRIGRLMAELGLVGRQRKRYRVVTTDSNHDEPIAPNRLAEAPP